MALQIRRGTNAERIDPSFVPLEGELVYTTDTRRVYVGDGSTVGGTDISAGIESVLEDSTPQLGGNLDLNGHDVYGTGNININGTITATGNISLGDGVGNDNVGIFGSLTTSLVPAVDSNNDIGSDVLRWRNGYFTGLTVNGQINIDNAVIDGDIIKTDSTVVYNSATSTFTGELVGSVFADDSTVLVDAINGKLLGTFEGAITSGNATFNNTLDISNSNISASNTTVSYSSGSSINFNNATVTNFDGGVMQGTLNGDIKGSVFGDDSSLIVDGIGKNITANNVNVGTAVISRRILLPEDVLNIEKEDRSTGNVSNRTTSIDGTSQLFLTRSTTADLTGNQSVQYGGILFERNDANGAKVTSAIFSGETALVFQNNESGYTGAANETVSVSNGKLGVGTYVADEALDVVGNAVISGFVQFGSLTSVERDALTAANGMVIYNTTDNKFQGYENGAWVNLI